MNVTKPISAVLKEARQNKGVSLEEAYNAIKVHPKILRALEEGATLELDKVYVKSYIKIYANYLGVSKDQLDKYFHPPILKEKKLPIDFHVGLEGERVKTPFRFGLPTLAGIKLQLLRFRGLIIIVIAVILVFLIVSKMFSKKDKPVVVNKAVAVKQLVLKKEGTKKEEVKLPTTAKVADILRLTIFAEEDTWMQIKSDKKVVFKRILKKSTSETWQAKDSLELWLANAGTVKLELNGKILAPIGRRGQLLKSVLITKDGLKIQR